MSKYFFCIIFLLFSFTISGNLKRPKRLLASNDEISVAASATKTISGTTETISSDLTASAADTSILLLKSSATGTVADDITLSKTGGDSSNTENSEFYGINAGVLVTTGCTLTIGSATITTAAKGSNAVFATGTNAVITLSGTTITTTGSGSARGLDATYGGKITADDVKITTQGGSCATLATDRGEGTVSCNDCTLETNGAGSPIIYSTGTITLTDSTGTANGSQMVVIEGKNSATVSESTLSCSGKGNRNNVDDCGVMIYQSMSGDADTGTGTFTCTSSKMSIDENSDYYDSAPFFFITNTDAVVNLNGCTLNYGSGIFLSAKGTDEWGTSGSNGATITMTLTNQEVEGNIVLDNISTLTLKITGTSSFTGTINGDNTAKSITIELDSTSSIILTGNSYVTSITNGDSTGSNINSGSYTLTTGSSSSDSTTTTTTTTTTDTTTTEGSGPTDGNSNNGSGTTTATTNTPTYRSGSLQYVYSFWLLFFSFLLL